MSNLTQSELVKKLALGTAQFGLDYGISNKAGKVAQIDVNRILELAKKVGLETIDTAVNYGDSEKTLGKAPLDLEDFQIVSKCPGGKFSKREMEQMISRTLANLGVETLYGFLAHDYESLKNETFWDCLREFKESGTIKNIGVSVYYPWQAEWLTDNLNIDIIQFPYNIFDQRFKYLLPDLKQKNIEVHIRSVFLQGLFFLPVEKLSGHFDGIKSRISDLQTICNTYEVSISDLLLNFCLIENMIDKAIIGVTSLNELKQNIQTLNAFQMMHEENIFDQLHEFEIHDESVLLPFNWQVG